VIASHRIIPHDVLAGETHAHFLLCYVHLGSPWGAGTFAAADGSRQPTVLELEMANIQGKSFWERISKIKF
jgi:multimeric flavodoxin WrbA